MRSRLAFKVRPARAADASEILSINERGVPGVSRLTLGDVEAMMRLVDVVWVAEDSDRVVGYLIAIPSGGDYDGEEYRWFANRFPSFVYVDQVAVDPAHLRTGVASALYASAIQLAADRDLCRLVCEVNKRPPNPGSLSFHAAHGFVEMDTLEVSDGRLVSLQIRPLT